MLLRCTHHTVFTHSCLIFEIYLITYLNFQFNQTKGRRKHSSKARKSKIWTSQKLKKKTTNTMRLQLTFFLIFYFYQNLFSHGRSCLIDENRWKGNLLNIVYVLTNTNVGNSGHTYTYTLSIDIFIYRLVNFCDL